MSATLHGEMLALTTYEFMLLRALAERAGRVMAREKLVDLVRGSADETFDRTIDVHISRLRQKLTTIRAIRECSRPCAASGTSL